MAWSSFRKLQFTANTEEVTAPLNLDSFQSTFIQVHKSPVFFFMPLCVYLEKVRPETKKESSKKDGWIVKM